MRIETLGYLVKEDEVCLAEKLAGFGVGYFNGFGGKVGDKEEFRDESIEEALRREAREEFHLEVIEDIELIAELYFEFPHKPEWNRVVYAYVCRKWEPEPSKSNEMDPHWFNLDNLPEKMWDDDKYWLRRALEGEKLKAKFIFDPEGKVTNPENWLIDANAHIDPERK